MPPLPAANPDVVVYWNVVPLGIAVTAKVPLYPAGLTPVTVTLSLTIFCHSWVSPLCYPLCVQAFGASAATWCSRIRKRETGQRALHRQPVG